MPIELPALGAGVLHALWLGTLIAGWTALTLRLLGDRPAALRHRVALAALLAIGLSVPAGTLLGADVTAWWCTAIGGTWLLLAMVRLARLINSLRAVRRLRAAAQPVTGPWTAPVSASMISTLISLPFASTKTRLPTRRPFPPASASQVTSSQRRNSKSSTRPPVSLRANILAGITRV